MRSPVRPLGVGRSEQRLPPLIAPVPLGGWLAVGLVVVAGYVTSFAWAVEHGDYDAWGTLLIGPVLVLVSVPLLRRAVRIETDRKVAFLIVVGFFLKLATAFLNHAVAFRVYGGVADARGYHEGGVAYSAFFRAGQLAPADDAELGRRFIRVVTGVVYTITGPNEFVGYLVFAWLGFWGLYLFYRAFVLAVPGGNTRRYAALLLLLPSTLFWTSAIGKEAWMMLALGTCALGAARLLNRRPGGLALFGLGLVASALCRPHLSVIAMAALLVAYVVRRSPRRTKFGPLATVAGLAVLLALGSLVASRFARHFDVQSLDPGSIETVVDTAETQSGGGGSEFTTEGLPWPLAVPGVLFRPLLFEANNRQALVAALEGTVLLALFLLSWRRLAMAIRLLLRNAYVVFCTAYSVMFLFAFSALRNFGILARQRPQVIPLVLVLLALPLAHKRRGGPRKLGPPPFEGARTPGPADAAAGGRPYSPYR